MVIYLILDLFSKSPFRSFPPRFRKLCLIGAAALCWAIWLVGMMWFSKIRPLIPFCRSSSMGLIGSGPSLYYLKRKRGDLSSWSKIDKGWRASWWRSSTSLDGSSEAKLSTSVRILVFNSWTVYLFKSFDSLRAVVCKNFWLWALTQCGLWPDIFLNLKKITLHCI